MKKLHTKHSERVGALFGTPVVTVDRVEKGGYDQAVIDPCPFCGEEHRHGYDGEETEVVSQMVTVRTSHCNPKGDVTPDSYCLMYVSTTDGVDL